MKKKVLFAVFVLAAFAVQAQYIEFSATAPSGQTLYYQINGSNVTVLSADENPPTGSLTIPASVTHGGNTYAVTTIGSFAFAGRALTSVSIPSSVTTIKEHAFWDCDNLTTISIPDNVDSLGEYVFSSCDSLSSAVIGARIIGVRAFYNCSALSSITMTGHVATIGESAFGKCVGLTTVNIPDNVNIIGPSAFSECTGLSTVTMGSGVTEIGMNAFYGCSSLSSCNIPAGIVLIGNGAFSYCTSLSTVSIPGSSTSVGSGAFEGCTSLASAIIGDGVISVGANAFRWCSTLSSVSLGNSITVIPEGLFYECTNLSSITFPNGLDTIKHHAFYHCESLASVIVPDGVLAIESNAFVWCYNLTSITIPASVTTIGESAFAGYGNDVTVYMLGSTPPENFNLGISGTVYVPCNAGAAYAAAMTNGYGPTIVDTCATLTIINNGSGDMEGYDDDVNEISLDSDTTVISQSGTYNFYFYSAIDPAFALENDLQLKVLTHLYIDSVDYINGGYPSLSIYTYGEDNALLVMYYLTIAHSSSHIIEAVFEDIDQYTLTVLSSDTTLGNVTGEGNYLPNDAATITAMAHGGSTFNGWSNGSMENPLSITVTSDTTLIALFSTASVATTDTLWTHDTITVVDTVTLTEFVPVHDTSYIVLTDTLTVTLYDTIINTVYDTITNTVFDTVDNYIHDTSIVTDTLWLTQYDTIWLYDTVVVHDTIYITQEGVEGAETANAKIYQRDGHVVVEGMELQTVALYDAVGRVMAVKRNEGDAIRFDVPATGTYLVKVGDAPARRIVVVK